MIIIRMEMQETHRHDSIMIDIITFFLSILIFFTHVSTVTFGPIGDTADA